MNKVILSGIVKNDPYVKNTGAPCELIIETRDQWKGDSVKGKNNIERHSTVAWGSKGDWIKENIVKGDSVVVEGFLKHKILSQKLKDKNGNDIMIDGEPIIIKKKITEIKIKSIEKI